jgi:predicted ATPase
MARLDRLPHAKQVAQIGATIGREFPYELLAEVSDLLEAQVGQGLRELTTAGLATNGTEKAARVDLHVQARFDPARCL